MPSIRLSREELYERVWSKPTAMVAPEFGITDVALAKICKKLSVPKPPRGYWQKLAAGENPKQTALPPSSAKTRGYVYLHGANRAERLVISDSRAVERIEREQHPAWRIIVRPNLRRAHPLVREARRLLEERRSPGFVWVRETERERDRYLFDIRVSAKVRRRAFCIIDALMRAAAMRKLSIEPGSNGWDKTQIVIGEERVSFFVAEKMARFENPEPRTAKWDYRPTGELSLVIDEPVFGSQGKRWRDKLDRPLESRLNDFMVGVWTVAESKRIDRLAKEAEAERIREADLRAEEERRFQKAVRKRRRALERAADSWDRSETLRRFIVSCEEMIGANQQSIAPESPEGLWLNWAREHADRLDPLKNGLVQASISNTRAKPSLPSE